MKNWIVILLIFTMPLGVYAYLDTKAQNEALCKIEGNKTDTPKAKLIKFTSPMCSECKEVAEEMQKAMKDYKGSVLVEEVNVIDNGGKGTDYTKKQIKKYKISLVPTLVFVDKGGNVIHKQEGAISHDEILDLLKELED